MWIQEKQKNPKKQKNFQSAKVLFLKKDAQTFAWMSPNVSGGYHDEQ